MPMYLANATHKTCTRCHLNKLLAEFHESSSAKDGKNAWCKRCAISAARESRLRKKLPLRPTPELAQVRAALLPFAQRAEMISYQGEAIENTVVNVTLRECRSALHALNVIDQVTGDPHGRTSPH